MILAAATGLAANLHGPAHALGDVSRLLLNRYAYPATLEVDAEVGVNVTRFAKRFPDDPGNIHVGCGRDLSHDHNQAIGDTCLAGYTAHGVILQHRVQHPVRYLVAQLVGMAFGYRLRGQQVFG